MTVTGADGGPESPEYEWDPDFWKKPSIPTYKPKPKPKKPSKKTDYEMGNCKQQ